MANKLLRDRLGSSLVEFTVVFPVLILFLLGAVDLGFMLHDWAGANKAAYAGAHRAIVSNPVAQNLIDLTIAAYDPTSIGESCLDNASGGPSGYCLAVQPTDCTGAGSCTNGYTYDGAAFNYIFNQMLISSGLAVCTSADQSSCIRPEYVTISYRRNNNLGFVGRPNGLPMEVTVSITGMTTTFYFLGPVMRAAGAMFGNPGSFDAMKQVPPFATTLISEDLAGIITSTINAP